jgi:hypothetical protein
MQTRFKKNAKVFDIGITAVAAIVSVGVMLYAIGHFGMQEASWAKGKLYAIPNALKMQ